MEGTQSPFEDVILFDNHLTTSVSKEDVEESRTMRQPCSMGFAAWRRFSPLAEAIPQFKGTASWRTFLAAADGQRD